MTNSILNNVRKWFDNKTKNISNRITKINIYNLLKEKTGEPKKFGSPVF